MVKTNNVYWPDISFGPVSLSTLPPAWWFYLSDDGKIDLYVQHFNIYSDGSENDRHCN